MYTDIYLKFTDEAEANSVLYTVTPAVMELDEEGNETSEVLAEAVIKANYANIDVIGAIYEPTAEVDADGYPVMVAKEGWHVNVRVVGDENATPLQPFSVVPTLPRRIWG